MCRQKWLCFTVALVLGAGTAGAQIDINAAGIIDKTLVASPSVFSEDFVRATGLRFLSEHQGKFVLLRLTIGTDAWEVSRSVFGSAAVDADPYTVAETMMKRYGLPNHPIARIIARSTGALLTVSDKAGIRDKLISGQQDPTVEKVMGVNFRLLHFVYHEPSKRSRIPDLDLPYLDLFFESKDKLTLPSLRTLTLRMQREFRFAKLSVTVRKDPWFFAESYPDFYRFEPLGPFPSLALVNSTPTASCWYEKGRVTCR